MKTITGYQCKRCGLVMYPKHLRCLNCHGRQFSEVEPRGMGRLLTYTVVYNLPWGYDERGRALGIVVFDDGLKALGVIQVDVIQIGMTLKASWEVVRETAERVSYGLVFRA